MCKMFAFQMNHEYVLKCGAYLNELSPVKRMAEFVAILGPSSRTPMKRKAVAAATVRA